MYSTYNTSVQKKQSGAQLKRNTEKKTHEIEKDNVHVQS
jgi:hypothetical protein